MIQPRYFVGMGGVQSLLVTELGYPSALCTATLNFLTASTRLSLIQLFNSTTPQPLTHHVQGMLRASGDASPLKRRRSSMPPPTEHETQVKATLRQIWDWEESNGR